MISKVTLINVFIFILLQVCDLISSLLLDAFLIFFVLILSGPTNDMLRKIGAAKVAGRIASCKVADINFLGN